MNPAYLTYLRALGIPMVRAVKMVQVDHAFRTHAHMRLGAAGRVEWQSVEGDWIDGGAVDPVDPDDRYAKQREALAAYANHRDTRVNGYLRDLATRPNVTGF